MADDVQHKQRLLLEWKRRLKYLELQASRTGNRTDPSVLNEIEDIQRTIAQLNLEIESLAGLHHGNSLRARSSAIHAVHPYILSDDFTGRETERGWLSQWLDTGAESLLTLIAIGGTGKSDLAWYWINHDVDPGAFQGIIWWSFYEEESSFTKFLDEAIVYTSQKAVDIGILASESLKARKLISLLAERRFLVVLDGFERLLRSYAELSSAYRDDADADNSSDARTCINPNVGRFLRDFSTLATASKILITSRLAIRDLEDHGGAPLPRCRKEPLDSLRSPDALAFMRKRGIQGTDEAIVATCEIYGYHPLSLRVLAGKIMRDKQRPGDISSAPKHDVVEDVRQKRHHVLEVAFGELSARQRALLSRIAAFRGSIRYEEIAIIESSTIVRPLNREQLDSDLDELEDRGLLSRDIGRNLFGLHPIVRMYAYRRLDNPARVHARLSRYYRAIADSPQRPKIQTINDLGPKIEQYYHLAMAGRYERARLLYNESLEQMIYYHFGAYHTQIQLLRLLFPTGEGTTRPHPRVIPLWSRLLRRLFPRYVDKTPSHIFYRAWTFNALANAHTSVGQPQRAIELRRRQINMRKWKPWSPFSMRGLGVGYDNLIVNLITLGKLDEANSVAVKLKITMYWLALLICIWIGVLLWFDPLTIVGFVLFLATLGRRILGQYLFLPVAAYRTFGALQTYLGAFESAGQSLDRSLRWSRALGADQSLGVTYLGKARLSEMTNDTRGALEHVRAARESINRASRDTSLPLKRDLLMVYLALGNALIAEAAQIVTPAQPASASRKRPARAGAPPEAAERSAALRGAEDWLKKAMMLCHESNYVEAEPDILLALARLDQANGDQSSALKHAEEALAIAEQCGYRIKQADIHNFYARLCLERGDRAGAASHAAQAAECARAKNPRYVYRYAVAQAEALSDMLRSETNG